MRPASRAGAFVALCLVSIAVGIVPGVQPQAAGPQTFVQQVTAHGAGSAPRAVTMPSVPTAGNRLVVEVGVWNSSNATVGAVTDNAGDTFVKVLSFTASDHTELSVWTAPVATGGTKPTITAKATSAADLGVLALEYSGLSTVADATAVDVQAHNSGTTSGAATVSSGATPAATGRPQRARAVAGPRQRGQPDHELHGHAVGFRGGPDLDDRHGDIGEHHRAHERHGVHVHRQRHERGRHRTRLRALGGGHARHP